MTATQHAFPVWETAGLGAKTINMTTDTFNVGLIASGTFTWGATPEAYQFVSQFLAGDGTHGALTEVSTSGTGYTRQALTSVTFTNSGENDTWTGANPSWSAATFSCVYAFVYDATVGAGDSSHPILAYYDFGGTQTVTGATFSLLVSTGFVQWQYQ